MERISFLKGKRERNVTVRFGALVSLFWLKELYSYLAGKMGLLIFHLLRVLTDSQIQVLGQRSGEKAIMQKHLQDWL